jgi:hypothetical protein
MEPGDGVSDDYNDYYDQVVDDSDSYDYEVANEMGWDGTELISDHDRGYVDDEDEDHAGPGSDVEEEDGVGHGVGACEQ